MGRYGTPTPRVLLGRHARNARLTHSHPREGTPQSSSHGCLSLPRYTTTVPSLVSGVSRTSLFLPLLLVCSISVSISCNGCICRWLLSKGNKPCLPLDSIQTICSSSSMVPWCSNGLLKCSSTSGKRATSTVLTSLDCRRQRPLLSHTPTPICSFPKNLCPLRLSVGDPWDP